MQRIRRDDTVLITRGKERGRTGTVRKVYPRDHLVTVQGINIVKKHIKPRSVERPGGIVERENPIHASNVKLICKSCGKAVRLSFRQRADGTKTRVCRKCQAEID